MNDALDCIGGEVSEQPPFLDPMADDDQPGYMPTVAVMAIVHARFSPRYVRRLAKRNGYNQFRVTQHPEHALTNAMAVEITCREILDANRWLIPMMI